MEFVCIKNFIVRSNWNAWIFAGYFFIPFINCKPNYNFIYVYFYNKHMIHVILWCNNFSSFNLYSDEFTTKIFYRTYTGWEYNAYI